MGGSGRQDTLYAAGGEEKAKSSSEADTFEARLAYRKAREMLTKDKGGGVQRGRRGWRSKGEGGGLK